MSLKIRFLERDSIIKAITFFNSAQSDRIQVNNRSKEEFEWLFFEGLYKPAIYVMAIEEESDEIIGTNAGIFIPMISKTGEEILTIKGEDTLLSLDRMMRFNNRDILKDLFSVTIAQANIDNVCFMWGFTPEIAAFKRCGFKIVTQIIGSFYVIQPLNFYRNRIRMFPSLSLGKKLQILGFSSFNFFNHELLQLRTKRVKMKKVGLEEVDEKLFISFIPKNVYAINLNKDFLKWRIIDNPSQMTYEILEFRNKTDDIISYFILSHNKERIWFSEQFLFRESLPDKMKIMVLKSALNYCKSETAIMVRAIGFSHNSVNFNEMRLLTKAGFYFFKNPEESYFIFQNLSKHVINPKDVYLSRLNTQGIR